jgi:hypothetical protein
MKHTAIAVGTAIVASLLVAGCGSSSASTRSSSPAASSVSPAASAASSAASSTASSSSASYSSPSSSAGSAELSAIVLQPSDLPAAWTAAPHQADPGDATDQAALVACVGGTNTDPDKTAEVDSSDFSLDDASISSNATSYKSQSDLDADTALIHSPKISTCYQQLVKTEAGSSLPAGSTITAVNLTITPGPGGGPSNVVGTGTGSITVSSGGATVTIYDSVAFITGPLLEAEADFDSPNQPVPATMFANLVNAVATRAAKG